MVVAYLSLGLIGYLVFRLGALWFDRPIGAVAAIFVLTRAPFLSNGLRAYVDLPYIALCLGALLIETRRPRAGWPVLALLVPAGLLRPEAWLFSFAYLLYLLLWPGKASTVDGRRGTPSNGRILKMPISLDRHLSGRGPSPLPAPGSISLALAAPILWVLFDWITSGSPTYSFTGTRERSTRSTARPDRSTSSSTGRDGSARCCSGRGWSAPLGGIVLGVCLPAPAQHGRGRRGRPGTRRPSRSSPARGSRSSPLHDARRLRAGDLRRARPARLAPVGTGNPWRRAWQGFAVVVALCSSSGGRTSTTCSTDRHRPHEPVADRGGPGDLAESGAFEPVCGPIRSPTTAPSRASPSTSTSDRAGSSASASSASLIAVTSSNPRAPSSSTTSSSTRRPGPPRRPPFRRVPAPQPQPFLGPLPPLLEKAIGVVRGRLS